MNNLFHKIIPSSQSQLRDLNSRPTHYECVALPAELNWHLLTAKVIIFRENHMKTQKKSPFLQI